MLSVKARREGCECGGEMKLETGCRRRVLCDWTARLRASMTAASGTRPSQKTRRTGHPSQWPDVRGQSSATRFLLKRLWVRPVSGRSLYEFGVEYVGGCRNTHFALTQNFLRAQSAAIELFVCTVIRSQS